MGRYTWGSMSRTTLRACAASFEMRLAYCTVVEVSKVDLIAMPGDTQKMRLIQHQEITNLCWVLIFLPSLRTNNTSYVYYILTHPRPSLNKKGRVA